MTDDMKRIDYYAKHTDVRPEYLKFDDFIGREIVIQGVEFKDGQMGRYALINVLDEETGEVATFSSGGETVLAQLDKVIEANGFPVRARIAKAGRSHFLE